MIYIGITIIVFFIIFLLLNIFYVTVVRYHDQEEYIKRGSCSSKKLTWQLLDLRIAVMRLTLTKRIKEGIISVLLLNFYIIPI